MGSEIIEKLRGDYSLQIGVVIRDAAIEQVSLKGWQESEMADSGW